MNKKIWILIIIFSFIAKLYSQDFTAKEIIQKSRSSIQLAGSELISKLIIFDDKGNQRIRKIATITKLYNNGETEKKLMRFLAPADVKGTGFLSFDYENKDDDMWIFLPSLRKTRRIISSEKSKNFMGSEFTYSDVNFFNIDDFNYELKEEIEINGTLCWKITQLAKDENTEDEYGFSKKEVFIGKDDFVNRKSLYYDYDDILFKELFLTKIKEIDPVNKKFRATHLKMTNFENNRKAEMIIEKIILNNSVKDDYFSSRYLERN